MRRNKNTSIDKRRQRTFLVNLEGRKLPVVIYLRDGEPEYTRYPGKRKPEDVYIKVKALTDAFPSNPLEFLRVEKNRDNSRIASTMTAAYPTETKTEMVAKTKEALASLDVIMEPLKKSNGYTERCVSVKQLLKVFNNATLFLRENVFPMVLDVDKEGTCVQAHHSVLSVCTQRWLQEWQRLLSAELEPWEQNNEEELPYLDWVRKVTAEDADFATGMSPVIQVNAVEGAEEHQPEMAHAEPVSSTVAEEVPEVEHISMPLVYKGGSHEDMQLRSELILRTTVQVYGVDQQMLQQAINAAGVNEYITRFESPTPDALIVTVSAPTYCGFPVSEGDHSVALARLVKHMDNVIKYIKIFVALQTTEDEVYKLSKVYSGS